MADSFQILGYPHATVCYLPAARIEVLSRLYKHFSAASPAS